MNDVHELLRTKENQVARIRQEINALHIVAPLLAEPGEAQGLPPALDSDTEIGSTEKAVNEEDSDEEEIAGEPAKLGEPIPPRRNRLRDWLGFAVGE